MSQKSSFLFACVCFFFGSMVTSSTVPLFLWSQQNYFGDVNMRHPEANNLHDLRTFVQSFKDIFTNHEQQQHTEESLIQTAAQQEDELLSKYISQDSSLNPEVIVAIIYSALDSAGAARRGGAYSLAEKDGEPNFLADALASSGSSLILPHVVVDDASSFSELGHLFQSPDREIIALQLGDENEKTNTLAGCQALLAHLKENEDIFSNDKTDLIMVKADEEGQEDGCEKKVLSLVEQSTKGKYVALVTADTPKNVIKKYFPSTEDAATMKLHTKKDFSLMENRAAANAEVVVWPGVIFLSTNILLGLLVSAGLLLVALCGVNCLASIETPLRYPSAPYAIGKES